MNKLFPISKELFDENINIRFDNINTGFDKFSNGILEPIDNSLSFKENQENFLNFFQAVFELNSNSAFIDFYLRNLNSIEISNLEASLNLDNKSILANELANLQDKTDYFEIKDKNILNFITTLNTESLFFCTVFLKNYPFTIWGNYNLKFPVFFEDIEVLEIYKKIANCFNLHINSTILKSY